MEFGFARVVAKNGACKKGPREARAHDYWRVELCLVIRVKE